MEWNKINWKHVLKMGVVVLFVIGCSVFLIQVMAVDVAGVRAKAGVSRMSYVLDALCEERIRTGVYPDQDEVVAASLRSYPHIRNFTYKKLDDDTFELQVALVNIFRADTYFRIDTRGIFLRDGEDGEWRKWFANNCQEKFDDYQKAARVVGKGLKKYPNGKMSH